MAPTTETTTTALPTKSTGGITFKSLLSEDWVAFIIGGFIILAILLFAGLTPDFKFQTPVYQWASANDLFTKVLSPSNLVLLALIGVIFFLLAIVAVFFLGGTPKRFATGFLFIYLLGIISLVIAGNSTISYIGLE